MSLLINDESVMLCEADFPDYFIDKHHPNDYKLRKDPIEYELIYHKRPDHNRCKIHISVKLSQTVFVLITFICDTISYLYK